MNWAKRSFAFVVSGSLTLATAQVARADDVEQSMTQPSAQAVQQMPDSLDQIVAPIALYPDTLVAQILAASAYPNEVVAANQWIRENSSLAGPALTQAVNQQSWDPSVKGLTQFPLVLANMAKNLSWTWALGDSYETEPQNVLNAIQVMRQRAQQAGNLTGSPQEVVTIEGQTITIQPTEADTVYLPEYDPWLVYGAPIGVYPGWDPVAGLYVDHPGVLFGLGIGIAAFAGFGWGWDHWGADWYGHRLVYNHGAYFPHRPAFANRRDVYGPRSFAHAGGFHGDAWHGPVGMRYATNGDFNHVGTAQNFAFHGSTGFGRGFHSVTGGFHGGGFHAGGFHGGGRR
jgi:hypothetical protein